MSGLVGSVCVAGFFVFIYWAVVCSYALYDIRDELRKLNERGAASSEGSKER